MAEADCIVVIGTSLQCAMQLAFEGRPGVPVHVIDPLPMC